MLNGAENQSSWSTWAQKLAEQNMSQHSKALLLFLLSISQRDIGTELENVTFLFAIFGSALAETIVNSFEGLSGTFCGLETTATVVVTESE